jgi:hypothetical protein
VTPSGVPSGIPQIRATCAICCSRQRMRKDGTVGKHDARIASHPLGECTGSYQKPMPGTITETGKHTRP